MTTNQPTEIRVYRTWDDVSQLKPAWNDFLAQSCVATIFLTHEWLESWWVAYQQGRELFVLGLYAPDGVLMGVAPLYRTSRPEHTRTKFPVRMLRFLGTGTGGTSTSLGFIMRPGYEVEGIRQFMDWLTKARSEWDILDLHLMETELLSTRVLMEELARRGWLQEQTQEAHLFAPLPDKYETYTASLSKKMRTEIPYEHRRMLKQFKVDVRKIQTEGELPRALDALFEINAKRWQERGGEGSFGNDEKRVFCQEMARRFLVRGWLDFWLLELDGRIAAMEYGFRYGVIYYPLWVAIETDFQSYSTGAVLRSLIIQELIPEGIRVYEFMQGSEPYKLRWGTDNTRTYTTVRCAAHGTKGAMYMKMSARSAAAMKWLNTKKRRVQKRLSSLFSK